MYMEPPRVNKVINLINSLNLRKLVGHDNILRYFLQGAFNIFASALCYFIENAFCLGIFPKSCKIAKVTPSCKSGNNNNLTNYRPISILTCFSKIFEKLIHQPMTNFFKKNLVLIDSQYGFQNNMSTTHAVLDVLTTAYDQINDNNHIGLILLDFKKAFDTVCHKTLLSKLEHYGVCGVAHKFASSFLSDRQQFVAYQT